MNIPELTIDQMADILLLRSQSMNREAMVEGLKRILGEDVRRCVPFGRNTIGLWSCDTCGEIYGPMRIPFDTICKGPTEPQDCEPKNVDSPVVFQEPKVRRCVIEASGANFNLLDARELADPDDPKVQGKFMVDFYGKATLRAGVVAAIQAYLKMSEEVGK